MANKSVSGTRALQCPNGPIILSARSIFVAIAIFSRISFLAVMTILLHSQFLQGRVCGEL